MFGYDRLQYNIGMKPLPPEIGRGVIDIVTLMPYNTEKELNNFPVAQHLTVT